MEKGNWSKNQETKFSETHFAQKNWNQDLWERKKNTKIPGQKLLETSIVVKNLKQKNQGKNIKRNPKIKSWSKTLGR